VVAFQTWTGAGDSQVLVSLTNGAVLSLDHGDCFGATGTLSDPVVIVTPIPGVPGDLGRDPRYVEPVVKRIEAITDTNLLEAVARVPASEPWRSPVERRGEIASWLAHRRGRLREVMEAWLRR